MRFSPKPPPWRRKFALFPVWCPDIEETVWLEWYWSRYCGNALGAAWEARANKPADAA
jgi:hypothetical protein